MTARSVQFCLKNFENLCCKNLKFLQLTITLDARDGVEDILCFVFFNRIRIESSRFVIGTHWFPYFA